MANAELNEEENNIIMFLQFCANTSGLLGQKNCQNFKEKNGSKIPIGEIIQYLDQNK